MARCLGCRVVYPILLFILAATISAMAQENPGADVYAKRCAMCHDKAAVRMPSRSVLQQRSAAFILKTLNAGVMKAEAAPLSDAERAQVAGWLGRKTALGLDKTALANPCRAAASAAASSAAAWTSWGGGLENQRFQPAAAAGLTAAQAANLKLEWAFGVPDVTSLRSQPVVFDGNLLFGGGSVLYSLDAASGCTHWATELPSAIRSGIVIGSPANKPLAFFGDAAANVYAVDAASGAPVWQMRADSHPSALITGTPTYYEGRLYVPVSSFEEGAAVRQGYTCCTFRGSVMALDAATGKLLWQTFTIDRPATETRVTKLGTTTKGPSGAAVWSAPTVDPAARVLYIVTGDNYSDPPTDTSDALFALALDSGKVEWWRQFRANDAYNISCVVQDAAKNCPDSNGPDFDFGASPILLSRPGGKSTLILAQKSGAVYALDPQDHGKLLWQAQIGRGGSLGGVEWGPAADREQLYVALSDESFLSTGGLDPVKGGGLFALSLKNGKVLWSAPPSPCVTRKTCSPAQTAAVTAIPGVVFSASLSGHARAFAATDGKVLWDFNTVRDFQTINGVPARGGSISVAGPVIAGGTVFILSGYDTFGETPGNVLLAFTPDGN